MHSAHCWSRGESILGGKEVAIVLILTFRNFHWEKREERPSNSHS